MFDLPFALTPAAPATGPAPRTPPPAPPAGARGALPTKALLVYRAAGSRKLHKAYARSAREVLVALAKLYRAGHKIVEVSVRRPGVLTAAPARRAKDEVVPCDDLLVAYAARPGPAPHTTLRQPAVTYTPDELVTLSAAERVAHKIWGKVLLLDLILKTGRTHKTLFVA